MNEVLQPLGSDSPDLVDHLDIAGLTLDLRREELRDGAGARIDLRNRSFGVLRYLAINAGRVITKDELLEANWPGVTVTEDSLTQCISEIRRALGAAGRDLIRTVPRRGYMILLPEPPAHQPAAAPPVQGLPVEERTVEVSHPISHSVSWYRHVRIAIPAVLFGAAVLALWAVWSLTGTRSSAVPASPVSTSRGPVVAVLPFENNTGDSRQDPLADGLTQAMISALGRFDQLRVLSRGVTSAYKGRIVNTTDLGRMLGADYAVDGNLRRDGDVMRIDVQLSDARTGEQV
jgi:TolB-like protein/DNA-binding winged helix-turn-helix (wHTH) protein